MANHLATLKELETYYSYEDMLNLLEVLRVDTANQERIQRAAEREAKWRQ